ncbi:ABC transporter ATP-binding protein [Halorarum salinum]|uniref:ABC transporter ATP-binding protein n=1 Tax=Halorarum salinum TaxID=2743089 RepID=A0A7D5QGE9_9EURY|nr:ABC transporter ATP-binding protein [Halobaculum salinum]QLG61424.1 ABC transporter ATP-binding protein [Halobaculum salinum]
MSDPLLAVRNLEKHYPITEGVLRREVGRVRAVDGVTFEVARGETLGLVGESGCGKSTVGRCVLRLEEPTGGEVVFDGEDVLALSGRARKRFRRRAQLVPQDAAASLDPRMSVGQSVAEPLAIHGYGDRERRRAVVADLLERVGLDADDVARYPHELSGGQKRRVAIARALVLNPALVVADEPVAGLDVSVQAAILRLLARVRDRFDLAMLFVSHDLSVVREVCDRVAVMYLGELVELAPTERLFTDPGHPYTRALLSAVPARHPRERGRGTELPGDVPSPANPPPGCRFHTRCPEVIPPPDSDFGQGAWRAVMTLRQDLAADDLDLRFARELAGTDDPDALAAAVRRAYDVPAELSDPAAERVLTAALATAVRGDGRAAADRLADEFPTVCEHRHPRRYRAGEGQWATCHLHDEALDANAGQIVRNEMPREER